MPPPWLLRVAPLLLASGCAFTSEVIRIEPLASKDLPAVSGAETDASRRPEDQRLLTRQARCMTNAWSPIPPRCAGERDEGIKKIRSRPAAN